MSNKLTSNTSSIQLILEAVNNLPNGADDGSTSDATAVAGEIFAGKTAYARGAKLTGTFTIEEELAAQNELLEELAAALEGKAAGSGEDLATRPRIKLQFPSFSPTDMGLTGTNTQICVAMNWDLKHPAFQGYVYTAGLQNGGYIETCGVFIPVGHSGNFLDNFVPTEETASGLYQPIPGVELFEVTKDITFTLADNAPD